MSPSRRQQNVLFVTYGGGHVAMCVPVIQALKRRYPDRFNVQVLGLNTAKQVLDAAGIPSLALIDVIELSSVARSHGEKLLGQLPTLATSVDESIAYLGANYEELEQDHGAVGAAIEYEKRGRHAFLPVRLLESIIRRLGADIVVATNSPRSERAAILAARKLGIPALCMIDLFAIQGVKWIGEKSFANRVCVLSDWVKRRVLDAGRDEQEVVVTGNPAFDRLGDESVLEQLQRLAASRETRTDRLVVWASQPEPTRHPFDDRTGDASLPKQIDDALLRIADRRPDLRFVFRFHPSEAARSLPHGVKNVSTSMAPDDLTRLLIASDVVIVTASTVGLEAALLGKPVISVERSMFNADAPFAEMGISRGVSDLERLEAAIDEALLNKGDRGALLPRPGGAADAVVDQICGISSMNSPTGQ